jgi:hypothetical protein
MDSNKEKQVVSELMVERYKIIAGWPFMNHKVGDILLQDNLGCFHYNKEVWLNSEHLDVFPHLFQKLEWWQERTIEELEPEVWADIEGYEGSYQVSSYGRVKSLSRITKRKHKGIKEYEFIRKEKIVKNQKQSGGYLKVELSKDDITEIFYVHRLVAKCFVPNPDNKPYVNHILNVRDFNYYKFLEWCTQSENLNHSIKTNGYCEKIKTRKKPSKL